MKIGILGVSSIARTSALAMQESGSKIIAVLSRSLEKAEKFKDELGAKRAYDDLDQILSDEEVDTVYVGLPNSLHFEYAKKSLLANKNVLLEKPFTMTYKEALELKNLAISRHLYLFETIVTLYQPLVSEIKEKIEKIKPIHLAILNFTKYSSRYDDYLNGLNPNNFNKEMGGGAMLDLNIYNLHLANLLFGRPQKAKYEANDETGIDTSGVIHMKYPGLLVECIAGKDCDSESFALISGEKGMVKIEGSPSIVKNYTYIDHDGNKESKVDDTDSYVNEFKAMDRFIKKGAYKEHLDLLDWTLNIMKQVDELRSDK